MSDLLKKLQAAAMLAQELHITLEEAEKKLAEMVKLNSQIAEAQREAAAMVDEMLD